MGQVECVDLQSLWKHQTDCILDERITNLDAPSNIHRKPEAVLLSHEREKKKKYLHACLDPRRHFSPFVVSWDGVWCLEMKPGLCYKNLQEAALPRNPESPIPKL